MSQPPTFGQVLLMRHPETIANVEEFFSGQADVPLTQAGEIQCKQAIAAGIAWAPERIFCSPLARTRAIAEPVAQTLGIECVFDERLLELNFGPLEGMRVSSFFAQGYEFPWPLNGQGLSQPYGDAESFEHIIARAQSFAEDVAKLPGKTLCVTHGGLTRAFIAAVYDIPVKDAWRHEVFNVTSQLFLSNGSKLSMYASGLLPEEVIARSKDA